MDTGGTDERTDQLLEPYSIESFSISELFRLRLHTNDQLTRMTVCPMRKANANTAKLTTLRQDEPRSIRATLFQPFSLIGSDSSAKLKVKR